MSATAWVLALDFGTRHAAAAAQLMPLLLTTLALLELSAPLLVMASLRLAGEIDVQRMGKKR
jgi:hypothetical protein